MFGDLKLLNMASALARHAADRHQVLASNIANADTAGYKAKDVEPFAEAFVRSQSHVTLMTGASDSRGESWRIVNSSTPGAASPNGNTVSLEDQMIRTSEAQQSHAAATAIYKKSIEILRLTLGRNA